MLKTMLLYLKKKVDLGVSDLSKSIAVISFAFCGNNIKCIVALNLKPHNSNKRPL